MALRGNGVLRQVQVHLAFFQIIQVARKFHITPDHGHQRGKGNRLGLALSAGFQAVGNFRKQVTLFDEPDQDVGLEEKPLASEGQGL